jgi:rhamnogalacturonan endolyase
MKRTGRYGILTVITVGMLSLQQQQPLEVLILNDDFSGKESAGNYIIEKSNKDTNAVQFRDGQMELDSEGGLTVWYREKLKGDIRISFDRMVVMEGGPHDRLSDLNQFWMANDPGDQLFKRTGGFREYDSLLMYYVGMGGNYNKTTRMRRYDGRGTLEMVGEYTDSAHLLKPNHWYHIDIITRKGINSFIVDGVKYFEYEDKNQIGSGWFAFRSTKSRQRIDNLKIYAIE